MPLSEFIPATIEGLKRGELHIPVGSGVEEYEKYKEGDKALVTASRFQMLKQSKK